MEREWQIKKRTEGSGNEAQETTIDYADVFTDLSFWYHLPYSEIRSMPMSAIRLYMERLPRQQAAMRLLLGEAAQVPHMDESGRRDWSRSIEDALHDGKTPKKVSSPALLKKIGFGVEIVKG